MNGLAAATYEPAIQLMRLERLHLEEPDPSSPAACLRLLRDAGLRVAPSRINPGGLLGGMTEEPALGTTTFGEAFLVRPIERGFAFSVPGIGLLDEVKVSSLRAAAEGVLAAYRLRGRLRPAT